MSSTLFYGVKVFAIPLPEQTFYLLAQNTAESNTDPGTPHWSVSFMGTYEECIERIILHASSFHQGSSRIFTGSADWQEWLSLWRDAFKNPIRYAGKCVFRFGEYLNVSESQRSMLSAAFAGLVKFDSAAHVELDIANRDQMARLSLLFKDARQSILPWQVFTPHEGRASPLYGVEVPRVSNVTVPGEFYCCSVRGKDFQFPSAFIWRQPNNTFRYLDSHYEAFSILVETLVCPAEKQNPGIAESYMQAIFDALLASTVVDAAFLIDVIEKVPVDHLEFELPSTFSLSQFTDFFEQRSVSDLLCRHPECFSLQIDQQLLKQGNALPRAVVCPFGSVPEQAKLGYRVERTQRAQECNILLTYLAEDIRLVQGGLLYDDPRLREFAVMSRN